MAQVTAEKELLDDLADHGAIEPIPLLIGLFIAGFKFVKALGEALIEASRFGIDFPITCLSTQHPHR